MLDMYTYIQVMPNTKTTTVLKRNETNTEQLLQQRKWTVIVRPTNRVGQNI